MAGLNVTTVLVFNEWFLGRAPYLAPYSFLGSIVNVSQETTTAHLAFDNTSLSSRYHLDDAHSFTFTIAPTYISAQFVDAEIGDTKDLLCSRTPDATAATCTNDAWGVDIYSLYCQYERPKLESWSSGAELPSDVLFPFCTGSTLSEDYTDPWTHTVLPTESVGYPVVFTAGLEKISPTGSPKASAAASTPAPTPAATESVVAISSPSVTSGAACIRNSGLALLYLASYFACIISVRMWK